MLLKKSTASGPTLWLALAQEVERGALHRRGSDLEPLPVSRRGNDPVTWATSRRAAKEQAGHRSQSVWLALRCEDKRWPERRDRAESSTGSRG